MCRRTREFEIRRALRAVERAEREEQRARYETETRDCVWPERAAERREWWAAEVERLEGRLQALLR